MVVEKGDKVKIHYTGTLDDGTVFDSSEGRDPLEFEVGSGHVIKGFDQGVLGMRVGQEKEIVIKPEEGYGSHNSSLVQDVPKSNFGENLDKISEGVVLRLKAPDGQVLNAKIAKISDESVTLDLNHPLAGKTLTFKVKLESIEGKKE